MVDAVACWFTRALRPLDVVASLPTENGLPSVKIGVISRVG